MNFLWWIFVIVVSVVADECLIKKSNSKLICYYSKLTDVDVNGCYCSHVVLPPDADVKTVEKFRGNWKGAKILVTINEFNQGLLDLLKKTKIDGLEVKLKKFDSKNDINDFISTIRTKIGSDLFLAVSVPSNTELVAKYYDFKGLSKHVDVFILQTGFLGASTNVTFHPSRLSGLWDMQNTDSLVDLTTGLGLPPSKLVITAPVQGFQFTLQNEEFSAPGSPAVALKTITRDGICYQMKNGGNWTLERDEDQAGPYIFDSNKWIAFEDPTSIDIKAKYSRIRGLAGLALKDLSQDGGKKCGATLLEAAFNGLVKQSRAPRAAVLHSFEREVLETKNSIEEVKVSPYRISRVIDTEGKWHVIRQDTRTEFTCSRQGYFVHPRSCNRFYRCVKFNQQSDEFNVFEFDCPAGLAFDERVEVCVWPGSLPQGQPCSGSSEIAPVPKQRFACPGEPGYYADPENCRWFFACLDHGKSSLEAYEFRCPFGLVFDSERLLCEWPWLVPKCASGNLNLVTEYYYGSSKQSLSSYDGLGDLGTIKLGGINGKIEQPIVYSNVDGHNFGNLGFKATNILYNAGLLKSNKLQSGSGHSESSGGSYSYSGGRTNLNGNYYSDTGSHSYSGGAFSSNANSARLLNQVGNSYSYSGDGAGHSSLNLHSGDTTGGSYSYSAGGAHSAATSSNAETLNQVGGTNAGHSTVTLNLYPGAATGAKSGSYNYYAGEGASLGDTSSNAATLNQIHSGATPEATLGSYDYYAGEGASLGVTSSDAATLNQFHSGATSGAKSGSYNYYAGEGASLGVTSSNAATLNQVHSGATAGAKSGSYNYYAGEGASLGVTSSNAATLNQVHSGATAGAKSGSYNYYAGEGASLGVTSSNGATLNQVHSGATAGAKSGSYNYYAGEGASLGVTSSNAATLNQVHSGATAGAKSGSYNYYAGEGASLGVTSSNGATLNQVHSGATAGAKSGSYNYYAGEGASLGVTSSNAATLNQVHSGVAAGAKSGSYNYFAGTSEGGIRLNNAGGSYSYSSGLNQASGGSENYSGGAGGHSGENFIALNQGEGGHSLNTHSTKSYSGISSAEGSYGYADGKTDQLDLNRAEESYSYSSQSGEGEVYLDTSSFGLKTTGQILEGHHNVESGKTYQTFNQDFKKNIEIVGGGYSAVGQSNLQGISYSTTPSTVTVSVPTVTSVPVPNLKVPSGFESYDGGVIANVPELQYKIGLKNVTQSYDSNGGYVYQKPSIKFEETPIKVTYSTPTPFTVKSESESVTIQPVVNTYSYSSTHSNVAQARPTVIAYTTRAPSPQVVTVGYNYPKPAVKFEEIPLIKPQKPVKFEQIPTVKSEISLGYNYPKPAIKFEEIPTANPSVSYNFSQVEYDFTRPVVKPYIEQFSVKNSGSYVYNEPSVEYKQVVQPEIISYNVQPKPKPVVTTFYQQPENYYYTNQQGVSKYSFKDVVESVTQKVTYLPPVEKKSKPTIISSYSYNYQPTVQPVVVSTVKPYNYVSIKQEEVKQSVGYDYPKPAVTFVEQPKTVVKPAVVSSYSYIAPKPAVAVTPTIKQEFSGYDYRKPAVTFVEKPQPVKTVYTYQSSQRPPVTYYEQKNVAIDTASVKPAVVSSYSYIAPKQPQIEVKGYEYPKPSVTFIDEPKPVIVETSTVKPAVISSYSYIAPKQTHIESKGYEYPKPAVTFIEEPKRFVVETSTVSSYNYLPPKQPQIETKGYEYPKPTVTFIEEPKPVKPAVVSSYSYQAPQKPAVTFYEQTKTVGVKPAVVSSYSYIAPKQPQVVVKEETRGYEYPKPAVTFIEQLKPVISTVKPAVVSSYSYIAPKQPQIVVKEESRGYEYPKPAVAFIEQPVSTTVKPAAVSSYSYEYIAPKKPDVTYIEQPKVKPAVVTSYSYIAPRQPQPKYETQTHGYDYPKPTVQLVEKPTYQYLEPVKEVPFIKKTAYTTGEFNKAVIVENYENYVQTTPKPTFLSTVASIAPATWRYYDSRLESTPKTVLEEQPIVVEPKVVTSTYLPPTREYLPVTTVKPAKSRIRITTPTIEYLPATTPQPVREYLPVKQNPIRIKVTTPEPANEYLPVEPVREYLPVQRRPIRIKVTTPEPSNEYLPVEPVREYLPVQRRPIRIKVTTPEPANEYLPVEPTREYLPVQRRPIRIKVTTPEPASEYLPFEPVREYLPVKQKAIRIKVTTPEPANEYLPVEPTREYLPVQRRPIRIKVTTPEPANEYLPVEPTREYLPVQRRPIRIKVTTPEPANEYLSIEPVREYLPVKQKAIRIKVTTPEPALEYLPSVTEELLKISSTPAAIPSREYLPVNTRRPVKVVKVVRPIKTIVKQNDLHPMLSAKLGAQCTCVRTSLNKKKTQKVIIVEDEDDDDDGYIVENDENTVVENYNFEPNKEDVIIATKNDEEEKVSDKQILKAVKTGLKLVKQAAKEGAKEGAEEALKNSSRVRNNIECQRAGLFRHPNQCNKFYSCRWDCKKNKFTLHTFNCPVHLTFDGNLGACNWPSQGPACADNTLLPAV